MQTFPRIRWGDWCLGGWIGYIATVCATVLLHKSTQVCATKYLGDRIRVCWYSSSSSCSPVCVWDAFVFYWVTPTQMRHPFWGRCVLLSGFPSVPGCKPLENCIFISIVYLLRHLFAFDLPASSAENSTTKIPTAIAQISGANRTSTSTSAFESFQNSFPAMRLENCNFRFEIR